MKEIPVQELSLEKFCNYGSYSNMLSPQGPHLGEPPCEFYRDMGILTLGGATTAGLSVTRCYQRPMIINELEYHTHTAEAILPLDGDVYIHVGSATGNGTIPFDKLEVFHVPQGTLVIFRPGVWHCGPFCANTAVANVLVVLPERAYANDCNVVKIPEEKQLEIVCKGYSHR